MDGHVVSNNGFIMFFNHIAGKVRVPAVKHAHPGIAPAVRTITYKEQHFILPGF